MGFLVSLQGQKTKKKNPKPWLMQQSMVTHLTLLHSKLKSNMSHLKCNSCIFFLKESQEGKPIPKEYYCLSFALLTL
jgi:hypothetical protein